MTHYKNLPFVSCDEKQKYLKSTILRNLQLLTITSSRPIVIKLNRLSQRQLDTFAPQQMAPFAKLSLVCQTHLQIISSTIKTIKSTASSATVRRMQWSIVLFKKGQSRPLFVYFRAFQTNNAILATNQCEKLS